MKRIITISREFGSGGRSVGKLVAEKLGYRFFDRELVNKVAERSGFSPEFIEESGEYASARSSLLFALVYRSPALALPAAGATVCSAGLSLWLLLRCKK